MGDDIDNGTILYLRLRPLQRASIVIGRYVACSLSATVLLAPAVALGAYFDEFQGRGCYYTDCTHTHEPDCGVKAAVEAGEISRARYASYLRIVESLEEGRK